MAGYAARRAERQPSQAGERQTRAPLGAIAEIRGHTEYVGADADRDLFFCARRRFVAHPATEFAAAESAHLRRPFGCLGSGFLNARAAARRVSCRRETCRP